MFSAYKNIFKCFECAFPTPKYLSLNPAGIDITPDGIYFMTLKKNKEGLLPDRFEKITFNKNIEINENISVEDREIVVSGLKQLKKKYRLEYVIASLSEQKTYIFSIFLPKEASNNIPSYIRYHLEENLPMSVNDVNFYYFITNERNENGDIGIVVSVFPKTVINIYTDLFEEAGLFPISFFAESRALFYSIVKESDENPYLLVRVLPSRISVSVLDDGAIKYTTDLSVNTKEAMSSLAGPGATLIKEFLNKVLIYWFTSKSDIANHKKIENVLLVGNNVDDPAVIDFLERSLKINVDVANVWTNCFNIKEHHPEIDQKTALEYAVSIGLAIRCINYA